MRSKNLLLIILTILLLGSILTFIAAAAMGNPVMSLQGNVVNATGGDLTSGNITVVIYDAAAAGNVIYNSSDDFAGNITSGRYDILLGSGTNLLNLTYGDNYWMEMYVDNQIFTFTTGSTRQQFQSAVGQLNTSYANYTGGVVKWRGRSLEFIIGDLNASLGNFNTTQLENEYFNVTEMSDQYFNTTDMLSQYYNRSNLYNVSEMLDYYYNQSLLFNRSEILDQYFNVTDMIDQYFNITDIVDRFFNKTQILDQYFNVTDMISQYYNRSELFNRSEIIDFNASWSTTFNQTYHDYINANYTNNSELLDGFDSSYFMPLNQSVWANFTINGGWTNGGLSITDGSLYAQYVYVYNISTLGVSHLEVNGSMIPLTGFDNTFDIGNYTLKWRDLYLGRNANISGNLTVYDSVGVRTENLNYASITSINNLAGTSRAVFANATSAGGSAYGLVGEASGALFAYGVYGEARSGNTNYAGYFKATRAGGAGDNVGLYGEASGGADNFAGWFVGDVNVTGTIWADNYSSNSPIVFVGTDGSELMWINNSGDVWIDRVLNVTGQIYGGAYINATTDICVQGGNCLSNMASKESINGTINSIAWNRSATNVFLANTGDSVGIGIIAPTHELHVVGDTNITGTIWADNYSSNSPIEFVGDDGAVIMRLNTSNENVIIYGKMNVSGNVSFDGNLLHLDANGNRVGIGSTSIDPNYKAYIYSNPAAAGDHYGLFSYMVGGPVSSVAAVYGNATIAPGGSAYGVRGEAHGTGTTNYGVYGVASGAAVTDIGVYGEADNFAGYFVGDVNITDDLFVMNGLNLLDNGTIRFDGNELFRYWPDNETIAIGVGAGSNDSYMVHSVLLGDYAGSNNTEKYQTAIGYLAGSNNTGVFQTAMGWKTAMNNSGGYQTAIGAGAGTDNNASFQVVMGQGAGSKNIGERQTALGYEAGWNNSGPLQTAVGYHAGYYNTGIWQSAIGYRSGFNNSGDYQVALGFQAGTQNQGFRQTALGWQAGIDNNGSRQLAVGWFAGSNNSGEYQTIIGYRAGVNNTGGNTTGIGVVVFRNNTGHNAVALGYGAGEDNARNDFFFLEHREVSNSPLIAGNFSSGYVGIRTANPTQTLEVNGTMNVTGTLWAKNYSANSPIVFINSSGAPIFTIEEDGDIDMGDDFVIDTTGVGGAWFNNSINLSRTVAQNATNNESATLLYIDYNSNVNASDAQTLNKKAIHVDFDMSGSPGTIGFPSTINQYGAHYELDSSSLITGIAPIVKQYGVYGETDYNGVVNSLTGSLSSYGVYGRSDFSGTNTNNQAIKIYGVYGYAFGNLGAGGTLTEHYGGYFQSASTADVNYGIKAVAAGGTANYAIYASGQQCYDGDAGACVLNDIAEFWHSEKSLDELVCETEDDEITGLEVMKCNLPEDFEKEFVDGDVVCNAEGKRNVLRKCGGAYDAGAISVISEKPTIVLGSNGGGEPYIVSLTGNAPVNVICDEPIEVGDNLVYSGVDNYAMRLKVDASDTIESYDNKMKGVIGKALDNCASGTSKIRIWI